jgi:hypothetical protein
VSEARERARSKRATSEKRAAKKRGPTRGAEDTKRGLGDMVHDESVA